MRVMHPRILQWELSKQKFAQCNGIKIKFTLQNRIQSIFLLNIKKYIPATLSIDILFKMLSNQDSLLAQTKYDFLAPQAVLLE